MHGRSIRADADLVSCDRKDREADLEPASRPRAPVDHGLLRRTPDGAAYWSTGEQ